MRLLVSHHPPARSAGALPHYWAGPQDEAHRDPRYRTPPSLREALHIAQSLKALCPAGNNE